jgi:hypothetical protein
MGDGTRDLELPYKIVEDKKGGEVEDGGPEHGLERRQHFGGNDGCYGNGRIMKSVDVVKHEGQCDDDKQKSHGLEASQGSNGLLGVFNNDRFDHIGRIFTFIRHDLHDLVDIPLFNDLFSVGLRLE